MIAWLASFEISALRLAGMIVGVIFMIVVARQVRHRTWPRAQVLLWGAISTGLLLVSSFPSLVSFALGPFAMSEGEGFPRIVGLLVAAVIFLFFYQFFLTRTLEESKRQLTSLVRELALARYARELGDVPVPDVLVPARSRS